MDQLTKDDLAQIDRTYLQSLEEKQVIDVACKLRDFAVILVERLEQNSSNSSRPPSSDSPYDKGNDDKSDSKDDDDKSSSAEDEENTATEMGLRWKIRSQMIPTGPLEGSLGVKGSGALRRRYLKTPSLTTRVFV